MGGGFSVSPPFLFFVGYIYGKWCRIMVYCKTEKRCLRHGGRSLLAKGGDEYVHNA